MTWSLVVRILWARRLLVLLPLVACLLAGLYVIAVAPKQYQASARVALNYIKPDPVTGTVIPSKMVDAYITSQERTIRDIQVAGPVAQRIGWLDNPDLIAAYDAATGGRGGDFERWAANRVVASTTVGRVADSNLIEIRFVSTSPEAAADIANVIRDAYIETTLEGRRRSAEGAADLQLKLAERAREELLALQVEKSALEKQTGVVLAAGGIDIEEQRLGSLAAPPRTAKTRVRVAPRSPYELALARADAMLQTLQATLGPQHPTVIQKQRERAILASQVAQAAARADRGARLTALEEQLKAAMIEEQKEKVISRNDEVLTLRVHEDEISQKRRAFADATKRALQMRQLATMEESGLSPVGEVTIPSKPIFPNPPMIIGVCIALGLAIGVLTCLLTEMLRLRVRSPDQLEEAVGLRVLAVLPKVQSTARLVGGARERRLLSGWRRRAATA
ncbi:MULTISPECIES: Wzz/FepE/Etk N-terminal domain-containing protein [unclassified Phenylobacterium]|uniref:Wzz/FepE/Etk N-terminal domain-containing protein n=1 Tax=unclassified Phenylobacterium TaxID=2640670 RepID=UPI00083B572F|nr:MULTISPECIES: Wzz/FepE/Etk N-terminal domain-containing protein [unclassified Phenylobacterium]